MGTRRSEIAESRSSSMRTSFRRVFVWYCAGILGATIAITGLIELLLLIWFMGAKRTTSVASYPSLNILTQRLAYSVPVVVLIAVILFFAWRMGRKVSQPVNELIRAVERIRQQDLDFTITYSAPNELGDLCSAFNELRRELQESLERE